MKIVKVWVVALLTMLAATVQAQTVGNSVVCDLPTTRDDKVTVTVEVSQ